MILYKVYKYSLFSFLRLKSRKLPWLHFSILSQKCNKVKATQLLLVIDFNMRTISTVGSRILYILVVKRIVRFDLQ